MPDTAAPDYGRDTFAVIGELDRLPTPDAIMDRMADVLGRFGIKYFCFNDFLRTGQKFEDVLWACRVPQPWLRHYLAHDYAPHDAALRMCRLVTEPFEYRAARALAAREPIAIEIMQRAEDFGVANGMVVPIPGAGGCTGNAWVGGERAEFSTRSIPAIHLLALYAFNRIRMLVAPAEPPRASLTARETEVLTWSAHGKSAWQIGEILGIAERTVTEHAQTAAGKLGAANRTQAVAIALRDRLIAI